MGDNAYGEGFARGLQEGIERVIAEWSNPPGTAEDELEITAILARAKATIEQAAERYGQAQTIVRLVAQLNTHDHGFIVDEHQCVVCAGDLIIGEHAENCAWFLAWNWCRDYPEVNE